MNPDLYFRALRFASIAHGDQREPDGVHIYLVHPVSVAAEVIAACEVESGRDVDLAVASALMHDVVEDTDTGLEQIERAFGKAVAAGVDALSKREGLPRDQAMDDSLRRIREQPPEVWMVKLADRIVNLTPPVPRHWDQPKKERYREEGRKILAALGAASPHLARRLQERIDGYPVV